MAAPDPDQMSLTERREEIARLGAEIEQDRYRLELKRLRLQALVDYGNGAVYHGRETRPPPIVANLWGKPRRPRAT